LPYKKHTLREHMDPLLLVVYVLLIFLLCCVLFVFVLYLLCLVSLNCPFLIGPSVFSIVYFLDQTFKL